MVLFFLTAASALGMTVISIRRQKRDGAILMRGWQDRTADRSLGTHEAAFLCKVSTETRQTSIIGPELQIIGRLVTCNSVVLEGRIEGDCVCGSLLIKPGGKLLGDVIAEEVQIAGSARGRILAKIVRLAGKATITGQVDYCDLIVERGAALEARVQRMARDAWLTSGKEPTANARLRPETVPASSVTLGNRLLTFQPHPSRIFDMKLVSAVLQSRGANIVHERAGGDQRCSPEYEGT